ncbi:MAG: UDP-N-acetylglucosamine 2-epimerase [Candidatus Stygibacter frigidus]|nr:UDP-N-acetylglucosamine 2-epimerase [Candidatus Stygibacter frigidus]
MKILTILGARPQFVKAAVLSRIIREKSSASEIIVQTGQHFDTSMSRIFFQQMDIPEPDYNLNINSLSHGAMTGRMIQRNEKISLIIEPNVNQIKKAIIKYREKRLNYDPQDFEDYQSRNDQNTVIRKLGSMYNELIGGK